jgi:hypothetical protein
LCRHVSSNGRRPTFVRYGFTHTAANRSELS